MMEELQIMEMKELILAVEEWSKNKGLDKADSRGQFLKVVEEAAEIGEATAFLESRNAQISMAGFDMYKDAIGDTYVTLIILAQQKNIKFTELWDGSKGFSSHDKDDILVSLGAIAGHLARGKEDSFEGIKYAIFNIILSLKKLALENGFTSEECLEMAYNVIAKRKGKMVDGVFVKEEDLVK